VAQTKRKRRRKHRGTQGGRIDTSPRRRPANRAEARQQAKARRSGGGSKRRQAASGPGGRPLNPPSWRSAIQKALFAGVIFFVLIAVAFGRPIGASAALAAFMLVFYAPMAYYTDRFFYSRRLNKMAEEQAASKRGG
jgi:Flp pilus assembly protein TadB